MTNWENILKNIPKGTSEEDFEDRFVNPFLTELGFPSERRQRDNNSFKGSYRKERTEVRPDYVCWTGEPKNSTPILIVETKVVHPDEWSNAVDKIEKSMLVAATDATYRDDSNTAQLGASHFGNYIL